METVTTEEKVCYNCQATKQTNHDNFSVDNSTKDGWSNYCKNCINTKARRKYEEKKRANGPRQFRAIKCSKCKFEMVCIVMIRDMNFWPYCSPECKYHDFFLREYPL